jgi:hypothetical protein
MPPTNRAPTMLLIKKAFKILERRSIPAQQVGTAHSRPPQFAFLIVFAPQSLLTRLATRRSGSHDDFQRTAFRAVRGARLGHLT